MSSHTPYPAFAPFFIILEKSLMLDSASCSLFLVFLSCSSTFPSQRALDGTVVCILRLLIVKQQQCIVVVRVQE